MRALRVHEDNADLPSSLLEWPPPRNFAVTTGPDGSAVSVLSDPRWDSSYEARRSCVIVLDRVRSTNVSLTPENLRLFQLVMAWFKFGERRSISPMTLKSYAAALKPVFAVPSSIEKPIPASSLHRFDAVVTDDLAPAISPIYKKPLIGLLDELYSARDVLGFTLLTPAQIAHLARLVPNRGAKEQTPFIPPRLWLYQEARCRHFLEEALSHQKALEDLFTLAVKAYVTNYGTLKAARWDKEVHKGPFNSGFHLKGNVKLGPFMDIAERYGVADLLMRWAGDAEQESASRNSVRSLARYFNQILFVGRNYLMTWSGIRAQESSTLRTDCLKVEEDPRLGRLYSLSGETTKTTQDDDARWVTAPEAEIAVKAMTFVARLRMSLAAHDESIVVLPEHMANPYLHTPGTEPWASGRPSVARRTSSIRERVTGLGQWRQYCPKLFDEAQLLIQPEDERIARSVEPTLNQVQYAIGQPWHFHPHQLRRTALVMMAASGEVSIESQQLQAKHLVRQQTIYYNRGFAKLRFNSTFATELINERYAAAARLATQLSDSRWISPYGEKRKAAVLVNLHHTASSAEIQKEMKAGRVAIRATLFGLCLRRDRCPYGGWDNYVHCPGCVDALLDRTKRPAVSAMGRTMVVRLKDLPKATPLHRALREKLGAVERFSRVTA